MHVEEQLTANITDTFLPSPRAHKDHFANIGYARCARTDELP